MYKSDKYQIEDSQMWINFQNVDNCPEYEISCRFLSKVDDLGKNLWVKYELSTSYPQNVDNITSTNWICGKMH